MADHPKRDSTRAGFITFMDEIVKCELSQKEEEGSNSLFDDDELWRACAGNWVHDIPKKEQQVYYFPRGHIEQLEGLTNQELSLKTPQIVNIPEKILCRVSEVKKQVEHDTDEVYAQITLHPEDDQTEPRINPGADDQAEPLRQSAVCSFSKILTNSDASSHGGFSIPKHAIGCFPPLDLTEVPSTQEFIAKDLYGYEWRFKHIYKGKPHRHMLTTGWNTFITAKKLVAGDTILFLKAGDGELRVGVRRRLGGGRYSAMSPFVISSQIMYLGVLASASHSLSTDTVFSVYSMPRTNQFVVGVNKYRKAISQTYPRGMRFKTRADGSTGTILGVEDYSPLWQGSKWRPLQVKWDRLAAVAIRNADRVCPWEIQPIATPSLRLGVPQTIGRKKRSRPANADPATSSSIRRPISTILQLVGSVLDQERNQGRNNGTTGNGPSSAPYGIVLKNPFPAAADDRHLNVISPDFINPNLPSTTNYKVVNCTKASSSAAIWTDQMILDKQKGTGYRLFGVDLASRSTEKQLIAFPSTEQNRYNGVLVSEPLMRNVKQCARNFTKVHMQGAAFGRTVDLTTFDGYENLVTTLEKMFGIKGELSNAEKWVVVFIDDEGDMMVVGDDPWPEFCKMVKKIVIYSSEEVKKIKGRVKLVMSVVEGEAAAGSSASARNSVN